MYTQCPHCLTLFNISNEELKAAAGKARCCQCNQVFNALETLLETPVPQKNPDQAPASGETENAVSFEEMPSEESLFADTLNLDSEQLVELAAEEGEQSLSFPEETDELFMIRDDGLETEPDYLAAGSESQMSELLDKDSASLVTSKDEPEIDATVVPINLLKDEDIPVDALLTEPKTAGQDELPQLTATPDAASEKRLFHFTERQRDDRNMSQESEPGTDFQVEEMFEKQPTSFSSIAWGATSLLLVLVLLLQLSWQYREQVIQNEYGQQFLTRMCGILGCTAPQRRDTSQIFIQHRDLQGHPSKSNALLLQLSMVNRADFAQPLPRLHLSLLNDRDKIIADRIFEPLEYLPDPSQINGLMQRSEPIFISMELVDPGKDVTGFKFEFL